MRAAAAADTGVGRCLVVPGFVPPLSPVSGAGSLTQDELYGDEEAARLFLAYEQDSRYRAMGDVLPVAAAAVEVAARCARCTLDVIALGPGAARREVSLVQHLVRSPQFEGLRLFLMDLAQSVAWQAHTYAANELSAFPGVFVLGLQGDMRQLPQCQQILHRPIGGLPRRRLVTMLGATLGNLDDEPAFVEDVLAAALSPGDLVLLDVCLRPAQTWEDPRLQEPLITAESSPHLHAWMTDVVHRRRGQTLQRLEAHRSDQGQVPGSYAVEYVAWTSQGERIRLARMGRYDQAALVAMFGALGFRPVWILPFGEGSYARGIFLWEYQGAVVGHG